MVKTSTVRLLLPSVKKLLNRASHNGGVKLDLGCGQNKKEGFIGVDVVRVKGVDIAHDLFKFPWPFVDNSVTEIAINHFFEHIPANIRFKFMDELYRILIPEGKVTIISPYYSSVRAIQDPTHEWPPISENSFLYFNKAWREQNKLTHYPVSCDFDFNYGYMIAPQWASRSEEARGFAIQSYWNVIMDIQVNLTKRKLSTGKNETVI